MKIFNETKNKLIASSAKRPGSLLEKSIGLIGVKEPYPLVLKTRFGIHTFGLQFPIDVLVLNKNNEIVALKENLRPFNFYFWNPNFDLVIELPQSTVKKTKTALGDKLSLDA